jgi:signal transduction histidine kinase/HAMP domain-containing protein
MRRRKNFSETGLVKALDPGQGLGFFQRFQYRLLGYLLALSIASSVVAGGIYYSRQVKFVEAEQSKRGSTLISNLAGQSELGAYSGDSTFLFGPARRAFQESDISFTAIYDVKGRSLIKMSKPGLSPDLTLPTALLQRLLRDPTSAPIRRSRASYDDLFAPVVSVREDPEAGLFGAQAKTRGAITIGVARLGLSRMPAQQKLDEVLRWGIYLALIVLAMGAAAALLLSRRLSQPIMALARGADEVRRGNLGYQLKLKRTDELGLMAESFNRMSSKLRQTVESLAHLNRNLEQEVSSRTVELRRNRDFVALLNAPLQLDKLLDRALNALVGHSGGVAGAIFLDRPNLGLDLVVSQGALASAFRGPDGENPAFLDEAASGGRPLAISPVPAGYPMTAECPDVLALLVVPVRFREELQAVLVLGLTTIPSEDLIDFVGHSSTELAIAVANARAFGAAERLARELERRNIALLQQRDQLQEVSRLKSEFLTSISHELRTPLNAVIGYTELISEQVYGAINDEQAQSLSGITENASHLLTLISGILDLSKVESGRMKVTLKDVDLVQLIRDVVDATTPLTKDRPYTVTRDLPARTLRVRTDPIMVRQILVNLLSNAIKFTSEGSVTITTRADDSDDVEVQVIDTGIGIKPEHIDVIFDEFRQIDGSSTRQHGGSGLGLAISRKFAALLGGDINVTSTTDEGSTFTLALKRARIKSVSAEQKVPELTITIGENDAAN